MKQSKFEAWAEVIILAFLILIVVNIFFTPYDSTDDRVNKVRSGMSLYIDHGTGCHYLSGGGLGSYLLPRHDHNNRHICDDRFDGGEP